MNKGNKDAESKFGPWKYRAGGDAAVEDTQGWGESRDGQVPANNMGPESGSWHPRHSVMWQPGLVPQ